MKFRFWGTRGSIPSPSTAEVPTHAYGGNTTCVSCLWGKNNLLVIDAGSGLRPAGLAWSKEGRKSFTFLFTHAHWDHLQGFPFFAPAFQEDVSIQIYSPRLPGADAGCLIEKALHAQQSEPFFPAGFPLLRAKISFHEIQSGQELSLSTGGETLLVRSALVPHPGGCFAYRLQDSSSGKNRSLVFATDSEPTASGRKPLLQLAEKTDLLICDGQYTAEEYRDRQGWGHGTPELCLEEAVASHAKKLLLTHFDPNHSDSFLQQMENSIQPLATQAGIPTSFAHEGQTIEL